MILLPPPQRPWLFGAVSQVARFKQEDSTEATSTSIGWDIFIYLQLFSPKLISFQIECFYSLCKNIKNCSYEKLLFLFQLIFPGTLELRRGREGEEGAVQILNRAVASEVQLGGVA